MPPLRVQTGADATKEVTPQQGQQEKPTEPKAETHPAAGFQAAVKRRQKRTEEDLLKLVGGAPSVSLDRTPARLESNALIRAAVVARAAGNTDEEMTLKVLDLRPDLAGLPLRRGRACRLSRPAAAHFDQCSAELRGRVSDTAALRTMLADALKVEKWLKDETVPVLMQMLMAESSPVREVLVEQLARMRGKQATAALARLALFDLHPKVREKAIGELARRDAQDYRRVLLKGFEHVWPVVADHAADALVALRRKEAVPVLVKLLDRPDAATPCRKDSTDRFFVKEVVRVNHLRNCLLCHPPSLQASDSIRGLVPPTNKPLDSGKGGYGADPTGIFVRADITYLKQDFSAMLPVARPGKWPAVQRFDFFVRERLATPRDIQAALIRRKAGAHPQREAMLFALRELTGRDLGPRAADWDRFIRRRMEEFLREWNGNGPW
jgi:hypothetical protein